ncbi:hypothetical protein GBA52_029116 [Prunus armeniaca]|nr:hypothetical protein GBA52_029116 [Prunus armeniaca]
MLGRGELRCIGATTLDEYRTYIEKDPALERRFQQVYVDQLLWKIPFQYSVDCVKDMSCIMEFAF